MLHIKSRSVDACLSILFAYIDLKLTVLDAVEA